MADILSSGRWVKDYVCGMLYHKFAITCSLYNSYVRNGVSLVLKLSWNVGTYFYACSWYLIPWVSPHFEQWWPIFYSVYMMNLSLHRHGYFTNNITLLFVFSLQYQGTIKNGRLWHKMESIKHSFFANIHLSYLKYVIPRACNKNKAYAWN